MTSSDLVNGLILVGLRLGGLFAFAPYFSSAAIPPPAKAILVLVMTIALGPMLVLQAHLPIELGTVPMAREVVVSLVFGLTLSLVMELANTAGQFVGLQMSFTLVNLVDPSSNIETSLFSSMFQMMTSTLLIVSGADRSMIGALLRTYRAVPLGGTDVHAQALSRLIPATGGVLLAAFQLAAPLIAGTVLVEISIVFLSRLSPQLPVMALTVPAKTLTGYVVLMASFAIWATFIERYFSQLLDYAQVSVTRTFGG